MTLFFTNGIIPGYLERDLIAAREDLRACTETARLAEKLFSERRNFPALISEQTKAILGRCGKEEVFAEIDVLQRALGQRNREEVIHAHARAKELKEMLRTDPKNLMAQKALESCEKIISYASNPEKNTHLFAEIEENHASSCTAVREALMRSVIITSEKVKEAQFRVDLQVRRCEECLKNPERFA